MPEAIAFYSRALAIKPDLEEAKRGLERLTLPKVDMLPTSPAPALDILKDTRRLERVTVPKAAVRPAPAATPEPTLETSKDAKPVALPVAIPRLDAQLADNNSSYKHSWARFWFLLARRLLGGDAVRRGRNLMKGPEARRQKCPTYEAQISWPTLPIATVKSCSSLPTSAPVGMPTRKGFTPFTGPPTVAVARLSALSAGRVPPRSPDGKRVQKITSGPNGPTFSKSGCLGYSSHLKIMEK